MSKDSVDIHWHCFPGCILRDDDVEAVVRASDGTVRVLTRSGKLLDAGLLVGEGHDWQELCKAVLARPGAKLETRIVEHGHVR